MIKTVSITDLRKNIFDLFNAVEKGEKVLEVEKNGKKIARICGYVEEKFDWDEYKIKMEKAVARLSKYDWSDVLEVRKKSKARRYKGW